MFVLDTSVLSELRRAHPEPTVVAWIRGHPEEILYTTAMNIYEIQRGIEAVPQQDDHQRAVFQRWLDKIMERFTGRILEWDAEAALHAAKRATTNVDMKDCVIGAIADRHDMTVVTRNVKHLARVSRRVVNPWETDQ